MLAPEMPEKALAHTTSHLTGLRQKRAAYSVIEGLFGRRKCILLEHSNATSMKNHRTGDGGRGEHHGGKW
jgi:hypothetical protein